MNNKNQIRNAMEQRIEDKRELKRKCELLLKIYEEGRIEEIKEVTNKYKIAGRKAIEAWLEYAAEPKPDPAVLLEHAGFDPSALGLERWDE
uniref:DUF2384 domain-containing protein n=2 Tax=Mesocestoides corti TaxID=53468 RepID=A0A5K3EWQ4_MESCO